MQTFLEFATYLGELADGEWEPLQVSSHFLLEKQKKVLDLDDDDDYGEGYHDTLGVA